MVLTLCYLNCTGRLILETADGELAAPTTTVSGNGLIAEIPNAVLTLPDGNEFQQFDPVEGIVLIKVINLPNERVQVAITGADAPPNLDIDAMATGLALIATPG
ncbi:MAG: AMIN domain-containing protein, partial [Symploca sp. SIO2G7]|nr:AMIN domain-containing protein [Symploca sp. SIO2G7]